MNKVEVVCTVEVANHVLDLGPQRVRMGQNYIQTEKGKNQALRRSGAMAHSGLSCRFENIRQTLKWRPLKAIPRLHPRHSASIAPFFLTLFHVHTKTLGPTESFDCFREEAY
jgi:hypothetical protein